MSPPPLLDRGSISYAEACDTDSNIVDEVQSTRLVKELYKKLLRDEDGIIALTRHHLGLQHKDTCSVAKPKSWHRGSFNVGIPVHIESGGVSRDVLFRIPMPHKLANRPGSVDEKLGCEVATYIWMQENCPDIRIPALYGFGFLDHRRFTHMSRRSPLVRVFYSIRRRIRQFLWAQTVSAYTPHKSPRQISFAYMILEYISAKTGQMLSNTWKDYHNDINRRQALFHDIAKIMLRPTCTPLSQIGSFQFLDDCSIGLNNRPLTCALAIAESRGIPRIIHEPYLSTDSYVADQLAIHEKYFWTNPMAIFSEQDCYRQIARRIQLRAASRRYVRSESRNGPYFVQFTDFHQSNILVDDKWNITCLIDLEWMCSLPREHASPPYWLTNHDSSEISGQHYDAYNHRRQEFMAIFREEERAMRPDALLSQVMEESWVSRSVWFWLCLRYLDSDRYLVPRLNPGLSALDLETNQAICKIYDEDMNNYKVVQKKISDYEQYERELQKIFLE